MAFNYLLCLIAFALVLSKTNANCIETIEVDPLLDVASLSRNSFPKGFIFGAGSSSYQVINYSNFDLK